LCGGAEKCHENAIPPRKGRRKKDQQRIPKTRRGPNKEKRAPRTPGRGDSRKSVLAPLVGVREQNAVRTGRRILKAHSSEYSGILDPSLRSGRRVDYSELSSQEEKMEIS